jgi:hypothetical protein
MMWLVGDIVWISRYAPTITVRLQIDLFAPHGRF